MTVTNQKCILKILNPDCLDPEVPAYSQVIIENKSYVLKNPVSHPHQISDNTYLKYEVIISGVITQEKGQMPNPLVLVDTISISEISFL